MEFSQVGIGGHLKPSQNSYVSSADSQAAHVPVHPRNSACSARRALQNDAVSLPLVAFDDLLWLLEFEGQQKPAIGATQIPGRALQILLASGLVERRVSSVQLTAKGTLALQRLL
jgi:hypothetical protein